MYNSLLSDKQCLRKGVKLLAKVKPNWYKKISIKRLNIGDPRNCILGQVFGYWFDGLKELGLDANGWACRLGFADDNDRDFWIAEIKKLRERDKV